MPSSFDGFAAHVRTGSPEDVRLASLLERALGARRRLHSEVSNLILHGKLAEGALGKLKGGKGYYNTGKDVLTLVAVLRTASPAVRAASAMTDATLDHYARLAYDLTTLSALINERSENKLLAWDDRARAYTLLWNAYSEARRALSLILWGTINVNDVLPPLMVGVGREKGVGAAS